MNQTKPQPQPEVFSEIEVTMKGGFDAPYVHKHVVHGIEVTPDGLMIARIQETAGDRALYVYNMADVARLKLVPSKLVDFNA